MQSRVLIHLMLGRVCGMLNQYWETLWDGWWGMEGKSKYGRTNGSQSDWWMKLKRINCEIRPNRPNGPIGESRTSTCTGPTKVGPILSHGPPVGAKAQTCPSRFKKLVLQAREACPASLRGLFSRSGWLAQQVCEACSARRGGRVSLL